MTEKLDFTVVLEPQPGGGFSVSVPALPEVVTEGEPEDEALAMAEDAIRLVLAHRREHGLPIPADASPTVRKITVAA
ncbi:MAG TPA: type II toxin-antitoxin system HicB family antitoxin [Alphaproteobacteria bacterium]|nr:type II toxin-antitoxin system HicB family antitoxin [Alphaproteobacteria bacterium]